MLVSPIEEPKKQEKRDGGIIIPDSAQDKSKKKPDRGIVRAVGEGVKNKNIAPQCVVIFNRFADDFEVEGKKFWLIEESDIYATINKTSKKD